MYPTNNIAGSSRNYQYNSDYPVQQNTGYPIQQAPASPPVPAPNASHSSKQGFSQSHIDLLKQRVDATIRQSPNNVDLPQLRGKLNACQHYHQKLSSSLQVMQYIRQQLNAVNTQLTAINGQITSVNQQLKYCAQGLLQLNSQQLYILQNKAASLNQQSLTLRQQQDQLNQTGLTAATNFDRAYGTRCLVGDVDMAKLNMRDPAMMRKYQNFIRELDSSSYRKRWDTLPRSQAEPSKDSETWFVAMHNGKIIGCMDYLAAPDYRKTAVVNIILDKNYHGSGAGKGLFEARNENLRRDGYAYEMGNVYDETNAAHIAKLEASGWRETEESIEQYDGLKTFWRAIDTRYANTPPEFIE